MFSRPALKSKAPRTFFRLFLRSLLLVVATVFLLAGDFSVKPFLLTHAQPTQAYEKELSVGSNASLTITNRNGRVSVITLTNEKDKSTLQATSPGAPVEPGDVSISEGVITVRERRAQDRIDLIIRIPARSRVKIESESGMVDVVGDFAVAEVLTNTGTIHADVPLDAVK